MANFILPANGDECAASEFLGTKTQRVTLGYGLADSQIRQVDSDTPLPVRDSYFEIAAGNRANWLTMNKFGENPLVTTTSAPEDVWDYGGLYTFSSTADISHIASTNNTDTQVIWVEGLDANGDIVLQSVQLQGYTGVALTTPLWRAYRMYNDSATDLAGDIHLVVGNDFNGVGVPNTPAGVRAMIRNGYNQTLMCIYTVPNNYWAFFLGGYVSQSGGKNANVDFTWRARLNGKTFRTQSKIGLTSTGSSWWTYRYPVPVKIPQMTDITIRCEYTDIAGGVAVAGGFDLVLAPTTELL